LRGGVVIAPTGVNAAASMPPGVIVFAGGHPLPNDEGARGAEAAVKLLRDHAPRAGRASKHEAGNDRGREPCLLVLISGGASALMTLPVAGVALDDIMNTSRALMAAGADIRELNCVRKHLDQLKGGLMATVAAGAAIRA